MFEGLAAPAHIGHFARATAGRRVGQDISNIPMAVVLGQPAISAIFSGQQIFPPVVSDAVDFALLDEKADHFDRLAFQLAFATQWQTRTIVLVTTAHGLRDQLEILLGRIDHGAAGSTACRQNFLRARLHRRAATRAAKNKGLYALRRRCHSLPQIIHFQRSKGNGFADEEQGRRFGIIQRGEICPRICPISQVDRSNRIAAPHLERQFALTGDALSVFNIADRPRLAGEDHTLADFQVIKAR